MTKVEISTPKKPKAVWIANAPKHDLASAQDFTGVTPTPNNANDINQNSQVYSRYLPGTTKPPAWREKKFNGPALTDTKQDIS